MTDFYDVIVFVAVGGAADATTTGRDDVPAWEVPWEDFVVAYERDVGGLSPRMMMRRRRMDSAATTTTTTGEGEHDGADRPASLRRRTIRVGVRDQGIG